MEVTALVKSASKHSKLKLKPSCRMLATSLGKDVLLSYDGDIDTGDVDVLPASGQASTTAVNKCTYLCLLCTVLIANEE